MDRLVAAGRERPAGFTSSPSTDKKTTAVTDNWYSAGDATFSDDGKYLLLTSSRDFKPIFGQDDFAKVYRDMSRVYLVTLAKDTRDSARTAQRRGRQEEGQRQGKRRRMPTRRTRKRKPTTKKPTQEGDDKTRRRTKTPRSRWWSKSTWMESRTASSRSRSRPATTAPAPGRRPHFLPPPHRWR